jgi:hypothetical protein
VNKCLEVVGCNEEEKVRFAAHLLQGAAAIWWNNYQMIYPIEGVTWDMFQKAFHTTYVLPGVMSLDKREFNNLRQGNHTVAEYIQAFGKIAHHALDDVNINDPAWWRMHRDIYNRKITWEEFKEVIL